MCDDRIIRCDMDGGFRDGRQFGRGEITFISEEGLRYLVAFHISQLLLY